MTFNLEDLVGLLSQTIGTAKAHEVLVAACEFTGNIEPLERDQALAVLEHIAEHEPGIVGLTARFAKSKLHLRASET